MRSSVPALRNAVERDPRFEIAQFQLAVRSEMVWRTRPSLEPTVARIVVDEYEEVLKLNPGNIRAWGNVGYVWWLLGDRKRAHKAYERGREYKQIQRGTDVGALDYGLARVAAEEGRLEDAYRHYLSAVASHATTGVSDARFTSSQFYFFDFIGDPMLERFEAYAHHVVTACDRQRTRGRNVPGRVRDSVAAFVLNDLGEALHTYFIRNADPKAGEDAHTAYTDAVKRNSNFVLPYYNLYLMAMYRGDLDDALEQLQHVRNLEPNWTDGVLAALAAPAEWANDQAWASLGTRQIDLTEEPRRGAVRHRHGRPKLERSSGSRTEVFLPEGVKERATKITSGKETMEQLERLLPHRWWWKAGDEERLEFDWLAIEELGPERAKEMDDLHVRALLMWDLACLLLEMDGSSCAGADVTASASGQAGVPESGESRPKMLLSRIKDQFWPANFRVLLTWRQLGPDAAADEDLRELVQNWLGADPTSHWALGVLRTKFRTLGGAEQALFSPDEQRRQLRRALEQCHSRLRGEAEAPRRAIASVQAWVEGELAKLSDATGEPDQEPSLQTAGEGCGVRTPS